MKMQLKSWSGWKTVALCALVGVIAAGAFLRTIPARYVSTAVIQMPAGGTDQVSGQMQEVLSRSRLTNVILQQNLYSAERARLPLETVVTRMKNRDIVIRPMSGGTAYAVSYASPDASQAQQTTGLLAAAFVEGGVGALLHPASTAIPHGPSRSRTLLVGLLGGVGAGVLFAMFTGLKVWKLAVAFGVAGVVLSAWVAYRIPDRYTSTAVLATRGSDLGAAKVRMQTLIDDVKGDRRFLKIRQPVESSAQVQKRLRIQQIPNTAAITIQFDDKERDVARGVTRYVVWLFTENDKKAPSDIKLEVLDNESFPETPSFPNRVMIVATGLMLGFVCAISLGVIRYFRPPPAEAVAAS